MPLHARRALPASAIAPALCAAALCAAALCFAQPAAAQLRVQPPRLARIERSLALGAALPLELLLITAPVRLGARLFASLNRPPTLLWERAARFFTADAGPNTVALLRNDPSIGALLVRLASPSAPPPSHSLLDRVRATFGWVPTVGATARFTDYGLSLEGISLGLSGTF